MNIFERVKCLAAGFFLRFLLLLLAGALVACDGGRPIVVVPVPSGINFYTVGEHAVEEFLVAGADYDGNDLEFIVLTPRTSGRYPLLVFQHGFISKIEDITTLLSYLAEHGFVVVAPQIYEVDNPNDAPSIPEERDASRLFIGWLKSNINTVLSDNLDSELEVVASTVDTGLLGHSRGGQVAWRILFDGAPLVPLARAIAGVDPVDGDAPPFPPGETGEMVTDDAGAFGFPFPSLIIGMGLGNEGVPGFECAPENRNYTFFYNASAAPKYEVVATEYGHSDMLNGDQPAGACAGVADGSRKDAVRRFISGQLAAYFTMVLKGFDEREFLTDLRAAPVITSNQFEQ